MAEQSLQSEQKAFRTTRAEAGTGLRRADVSLIVSILAFMASGLTAWTAHDALRFNKKSQYDAQKTAVFAQFQQQYLAVSGQFPAQLTEANFRPARGSGDYDRLEAYWLFCFSEWYATNRVNPDGFGTLWTDYYAPLVADGLEIPSLRYVLEDLVATRALDRGEWGPFLAEIGRIAREDGHPLRPELERRLAPYRKPAG
jgi:hypothetical protein